MKNQTKSSTNQIKNLINSSLKSTSLRRSFNHFDDRGSEQFESSKLLETSKQLESSKIEQAMYFSKKKTTFVIEEEEERKILELEKKNTINEEEGAQNSSERIDKEVYINTFDSLEKRNSNHFEEEEDDFISQVPRRITYDGYKRKKEEGLFFL